MKLYKIVTPIKLNHKFNPDLTSYDDPYVIVRETRAKKKFNRILQNEIDKLKNK